MRSYTEPTCKHLLREPLVYGVPFSGLIPLAGGTIAFQLLAQGDLIRTGIGAAVSASGYVVLRLFSRFAKTGWDQSILFALERMFSSSNGARGKVIEAPSSIEVQPPDTLDDFTLLSLKQSLEDEIKHLMREETLTLRCKVDGEGARLTEIRVQERCDRLRKKADILSVCEEILGSKPKHVYSLYQIPTTTDPLWLFSNLKALEQDYQIVISFRGVDQSKIKARIEASRRLNLHFGNSAQVDSDVSFEQAEHVLRGLSQGDDCVVEMSLVIVSEQALELDPHFFCEEKNHSLTLLSVLGLRARFHRAHFVRAVTASDITPHILDPFEEGTAILKTLRGKPLYFDPQDPRLDALHWLIAGATGTGKSFLAGTFMLRLVQSGREISVLFIDHRRSFKRVVKAQAGTYLEPSTCSEIEQVLPEVFKKLDVSKVFCGIELSDLPLKEKKEAASLVLRKLAEFLAQRTSRHVIYIVMDECWRFLKDDPQGVQQAFREFRKFDAAAVAITQSLKDFISDETGQSIIQNADITILLRQKEDVTRYQDILDLTEPEMAQVKRIKKKKGIYSECLIKTPFFSRFGRLYPTQEEHGLLRTDNLREERVQESLLAPAQDLILGSFSPKGRVES